jgi:cytosine/adenosine deaminase-related metal-dependent hydrolase
LETGQNLHAKKGEIAVNFKNHFLYPGLTNGHEHLEMNLYPKLGRPPYNNYVDWSNDIYKPTESPIREIEKIDIEDRLMWGAVKNCISGVTDVVHHNPWHKIFNRNDFPVNVLKPMSWAHSLRFEKDVTQKFPKDLSIPFIIHAGEGTDDLAFSEIQKLDQLRLLQKNTILIHAVALDEKSIQRLEHQQASIVWCPASNLYLFNKTAPINKMNGKIKIAIGTDSTLTGSPTLLDEMRIAAETDLVSCEEILNMVTSGASSVFNLKKPLVAPLNTANFFIISAKHENYFENLMVSTLADIALVLVKGKLRLIDANIDMNETFSANVFSIQGCKKKLSVNVADLKNRIERKAGSRVLELNPLWRLLEV